MKKFRFILFAIGLIMFSITLKGQNSDNPYKGVAFKNRITVGGDLGLSFGSQLTYVRIAPVLGYIVSPKFTIGAGPSFQYWEDRRYTPSLETTIYGGSTFGRYFVIEQLFLQAEFEVLNLDEINYAIGSDFSNRERVTIPVFFVGGGYSQRTAGGSGFFVSVMYDLIGDLNSPYPNDLVFRVGAFIGL
ncbi:hypothetical protein O3Q51_15415 [Cryomorphaceae bacterium 1068]|nr:hypothetical protein [Cryomorphaceae bacterium 1068]